MANTTPVIYSDDADPTWDFTVTDRDGATVDWTSPTVAVDGGSYSVVASWQGTASSSRTLRVPLAGLTVGAHKLYLRVPSSADILLGQIQVVART